VLAAWREYKFGMKRDQELTVITKTYDLILWSCNHTSRFVLGARHG
jgi:hypothetical protein